MFHVTVLLFGISLKRYGDTQLTKEVSPGTELK